MNNPAIALIVLFGCMIGVAVVMLGAGATFILHQIGQFVLRSLSMQRSLDIDVLARNAGRGNNVVKLRK